MPQVMIQYRAASFFGRMNCPDMIMGIYSQEEVLDMTEIPSDGFALVVDPKTGEVQEVEKDEPITQEQRQTLFQMVNSAYGKDGNKILKEMLTQEGYLSRGKRFCSWHTGGKGDCITSGSWSRGRPRRASSGKARPAIGPSGGGATSGSRR